jgi:hypothetical protein
MAGGVVRGAVIVPGSRRKRKQEVGKLMTVTETGAARVQEFIIIATSVASG